LSHMNNTIECDNSLIGHGNPHFGDCFEYILGFHRNPLKIGDLLGLELKIWGKKSQLSIFTYSAEKELSQISNTPTNDYLCAKQKKGSKCTSAICIEPNRHIIKMNEGICYDLPNRLNKLKYNIDDAGVLHWSYRENVNKEWQEFSNLDINQKLVKYNHGLLLASISGERKDRKFKFTKLYYIPMSPNSIIEIIKDGNANYEMRYKKDKINGIWDGVSFRSPGWGFRLSPSWVRNNLMIEKYQINDINDFLKLRYTIENNQDINFKVNNEDSDLNSFF
ncbi:MAG: hypothetical protein OEY49_05660, partial [Candidatus Heimdallarchaeota archaeon]|nr:hypothetical protein [Candidatus Heimdallarchaeota archaeon]